jgi:glyoxalase family protein
MHGIHHVTAIAGSPTRNLGFYTRLLGLRFVKKTVNFDDPGTYHFYYGDEAGSPGTILTFFTWEHAAPGRAGVGLMQTTSFRVPADSMAWWRQHLGDNGVAHEALHERFGEPVLALTDLDGMSLALVGVATARAEAGWSGGPVPTEHAIRGFHGATLRLQSAAATGAILTGVLGFAEAGREGAIIRYRAGNGLGGIVDIEEDKGTASGRMGRGSVHHIAFRAQDDAEQAAMARALAAEHGMHVTEQKDRQYFRSVYFREPGGILFEIATDQPGFAIDEAPASLGTALKLPPFLEPHRKRIEAALAPLDGVVAARS